MQLKEPIQTLLQNQFPQMDVGGFGLVDTFDPYFELADLVSFPKTDRDGANLVGRRKCFSEDKLLPTFIQGYGGA